jgi:hypothetical protein
VRDSDYSAGQVMNVLFAVIIGGFSLGQVRCLLPKLVNECRAMQELLCA